MNYYDLRSQLRLDGAAVASARRCGTVVGAAAGENDFEVANAPLRAKSMDNPKADEAEWVVLLDGADASAVGAAARTTFTLAKLKNFGVSVAPTIGTYRLLFGSQR